VDLEIAALLAALLEPGAEAAAERAAPVTSTAQAEQDSRFLLVFLDYPLSLVREHVDRVVQVPHKIAQAGLQVEPVQEVAATTLLWAVLQRCTAAVAEVVHDHRQTRKSRVVWDSLVSLSSATQANSVAQAARLRLQAASPITSSHLAERTQHDPAR
jgi:hypothetical protein